MFRVVTTSVPGSMSSWSPSWGGGRSIVLAIADGPAEGPGLTWVNWGAPPPLDDEDRVVTVVSGARSIGGWFGEWGLELVDGTGGKYELWLFDVEWCECAENAGVCAGVLPVENECRETW